MSKFILLLLFLGILGSWVSEPFSIDPKDERIDKYRPSLQRKTNTTSFDTVHIVQTSYDKSTTAFHYSKPMNSKY